MCTALLCVLICDIEQLVGNKVGEGGLVIVEEKILVFSVDGLRKCRIIGDL